MALFSNASQEVGGGPLGGVTYMETYVEGGKNQEGVEKNFEGKKKFWGWKKNLGGKQIRKWGGGTTLVGLTYVDTYVEGGKINSLLE